MAGVKPPTSDKRRDQPGTRANRRASRPPAVASAMGQMPMMRGDTGGLTRPISPGPAAPMGPLPPGGFGAAPKINPLRKPFGRGQQGIGTSGPSYDGEKKNWIKGAIKHPGALHRELGVPEGKKIPAGKLAAASHSENPTLRRRANLAKTLKKMH